MLMKLIGAAALVLVAFVMGSASAIFGALMLTTGSPTRENWISFYLLTYLVPLAIFAGTIFILIRLFR